MAVLVTGATGRLGTLLVARLIAEGQSVTVLSRRPFRASALFPDSVHVQEWHPLTEDIPEAAMENVSAVIHLMGEPLDAHGAFASPEAGRSARVEATGRLIAALRGRPVRFISVSVAGLPGTMQEDVSQGFGNIGEHSFAACVAAWEAAAQAVRASGSRLAIVRFGLFLAPGEPLASLVRLALWGLIPRMENAQIPAIDPEDAAALLAGLVHLPELDGPIFGIGPEPLRGEDLMHLLRQVRRIPLTMPAPHRFFMRRIGPLAPLFFNKTPFAPRRLLDAGARFSHADAKASAARAIAAIMQQAPVP